MLPIENPPDNLDEINLCELIPNCLWQHSTQDCGIEVHLKKIPNRRARRKEIKRLRELASGSEQDQKILVRICGRAAGLTD